MPGLIFPSSWHGLISELPGLGWCCRPGKYAQEVVVRNGFYNTRKNDRQIISETTNQTRKKGFDK
jgi:hypothetical protein